MTPTPLSEFEASVHAVGKARYRVAQGGSGSPLLLLHGFPETHLCWRRVAPDLSSSHTVVAPDLRGYGASEAPPGGPDGKGYSKRETAAEMLALMELLGHRRFAVVGHDRGARVAFRLALDHSDRVSCAAMLNIVPTVDQFERMSGGPSLSYWPWFFLAQPSPFPERMIAADPTALLNYVLDTWPSDSRAIESAARDANLRALTPSTIAAMCGDYGPAFTSIVLRRPRLAPPTARCRPDPGRRWRR